MIRPAWVVGVGICGGRARLAVVRPGDAVEGEAVEDDGIFRHLPHALGEVQDLRIAREIAREIEVREEPLCVPRRVRGKWKNDETELGDATRGDGVEATEGS